MRKEKARNPIVSTTSQKKEKTIKIFVSHRIDLDSQTIDNPLFVNVRCGAVYDKRKHVAMLGDDTGENISEKRESFCELTVQYWAWKNQVADYYGLCHYRRYFAFEWDSDAPRNIAQHISEKYISGAEKYGLSDAEFMRDTISAYDVVLAEPIDISKKPTPRGLKKSVLEHWKGFFGFLIREKYLRLLLDTLEKKYPEMYKIAQEYLDGKYYFGYNCFVMKRDIFNDYCKYLFDILFEIEDEIHDDENSEVMNRAAGYFGEILFGIYCSYLTKKKNVKTKLLPVIYFEDTKKEPEVFPLHKKKCVPIVVPSSDFYAPYLACLIQSAAMHNKRDHYLDFIILTKDITKENERKIRAMIAEQKNISVRFVNPSRLLEGKKLFVSKSCFSDQSYYRMLVPWLLKKYDKNILLEADMVCTGDVSDLYEEELEGKSLAAARCLIWQGCMNDPFADNLEYTKRKLKLKTPFDYVNTGVMVMDLQKIREKFTLEEFIHEMQVHKFRYQEQDIINLLFREDIKFLDVKYNWYANLKHPANKRIYDLAPIKSIKKFNATEGKAILTHFAGQPKPWDDFDEPYAEVFWAVARKTPFYELILHRYISSAAVGAANAANLVCGEDPYNRFSFPWRSVRPGSRIVLYGGGVVGKMFLRQLANNPYCHVVAVCDQNPAATGIREAPVIDVRQLCDLDPDFYDLVLIDLERKDIATAIRADLELSGIPPQKIKWVDPHRR